MGWGTDFTAEEVELLDYYIKGFQDELWGTTTTIPEDHLITKAYELGAAHAIIGDDVRSVDYLSNEEILKQIKNGNSKS